MSSAAGNLLGALALAVNDAQAAALREATGLGTSACAALVTVGQNPGETIASLSHVLELTHSVTVRLVEGLVRDGLIERSAGRDRRQVRLSLTARGKTLQQAALEARRNALERALEALPAAERAALVAAMSSLLAGLTRDRRHGDHICRLCEERVCLDPCPVEERATRLEGPRQ